MEKAGWMGLVLVWIAACGDAGETADMQRRERSVRSADVLLPNWATPEERRLGELAPPPAVLPGRVPPADGFRVPAEYEPTAAVMMTWEGYQDMLRDIAGHAADAGAEVWMVGGPSSLSEVPAELYRPLDVISDSVWARDYGPFGIHEQTGELGIVDTTYRHYASRPNDDDIPCHIADEAGAACYTTSLILDGGNFMTDGQGNLFMTSRTYVWNDHLTTSEVDTLLMDYFAVDTIHVFDYAESYGGDPADGTGHIDMFAKLLAPCKVLVAACPDEPYHTPLEDAATYFENLSCPSGGTYQVYRVDGWEDWAWYTYTNALIVNDTVIVPSYSGADNAAAQAVYQAALPQSNVVLVDSDDSIWSGGSVHCVTREIPVASGAEECNVPSDCDLPHVAVHDCVQGHCTIVSCDAGWDDCSGGAADGCETALGTVDDCAGCGDACSYPHATASCQAGTCVMGACEAGFEDCNAGESDGCETELGTVDDCGGCGDVCDYPHATASCQAGICAMGACDAGFEDCNAGESDGCETELGTVDDCGGCGDACSYPHATAICQAGTCAMGACDTGFGDCNAVDSDGCETGLGTLENCGACGDACAYPHADASCRAGACVITGCEQGFEDCNAAASDGCETALGTVDDCGGCGDSCSYPHATASCQAGTCVLEACDAGWADCDGQDGTGCETELGTMDDCSACGDSCVYPHAAGACDANGCVMGDCDAGWADCNDEVSDGCEAELGTVDACGGCGDTCSFDHATATCRNGQCRLGDCDPGFEDCNQREGDGCEEELGTADHCSRCDDRCSYDHASGVCRDGICHLGECDQDYQDCDARPDNGCETYLGAEEHCGGCDRACAPGEECRDDDGDGFACTGPCADGDGDGHPDAACGGDDCDDGRRDVRPGAIELCNGIDDDCDGDIDEEGVCDKGGGGCGCGAAGRGAQPAGVLVVATLFGLAAGVRRRRCTR